MGDYSFTQTSEEPTVLTLQYIPIVPGQGMNRKEQSRAGRRLLYELTFADFEEKIVAEMKKDEHLSSALRKGLDLFH